MYIYILYTHRYNPSEFLARSGRMVPDTRAAGAPDNFMVRAGGMAKEGEDLASGYLYWLLVSNIFYFPIY